MNLKSLYLLIVLCLSCVAHTLAQTDHKPQVWEKDIATFEQTDQTQPPPGRPVLFLGSSSIRFWEDVAQRFPDQKVINRGFGGSWLSDVNYYFDRLVTAYKPKKIFLYAGENDIAAGKPAEALLQDVDTFLKLRREKLPRSKVVFISLKPSPSRIDNMNEVKKANALIQDRLRKEKRATYVDVFTPMLDQQGKIREELFIGDRLHMNKAGYDLWTELLKPYL